MEIDDFLRDLGYREAETSGGTEFVGGLRSDVNQWMGGHCGLQLPRSRKSPSLLPPWAWWNATINMICIENCIAEITSCGVTRLLPWVYLFRDLTHNYSICICHFLVDLNIRGFNRSKYLEVFVIFVLL